MSFENALFIYRNLQPESEARLSEIQSEYVSSIDSFVPVENLHLTILNAYSKRVVAHHRLEAVIHNAPQTSVEPSESEVVAARLDVRARSMTRLVMTLVLDDEASSQYFTEHDVFKKTLLKRDKQVNVRNFVQPHVTLGYLDVADGVASIMDIAESVVGSSIVFQSVESNFGKVSAKKEDKPITVSTPLKVDAPVLTVRPGGIPQGLLASLRPKQ